MKRSARGSAMNGMSDFGGKRKSDLRYRPYSQEPIDWPDPTKKDRTTFFVVALECLVCLVFFASGFVAGYIAH